MMKRRSAGSRIVKGLALAAAGLPLLWLALPLWFPWVLRPLARAAGVSYSRYERIGYRRFALCDLTLDSRTLRLRARRLEALAPTIWCWRYFREHGASSEPFVSATGWQIELLPTRSGAPASVYSTAQDVQDI